jgi:hypothetical protein
MAIPVPTRPAPLPGIIKVLLRFDLAVLGLGALAFALLYWADIGRSAGYSCTLTRRQGILLAACHAAAGIAILILSFPVASSLGIRLGRAGEGALPILFCVMLFLAGFSSLGLAWKALRLLPSRLLLQVHPAVSAIAAVLLLLVPFSAVPAKKTVVPLALAGILIASLALALWQYRSNRPGTGSTGGAGPGDRAPPPVPGSPGSATVTGFPPGPASCDGKTSFMGLSDIDR